MKKYLQNAPLIAKQFNLNLNDDHEHFESLMEAASKQFELDIDRRYKKMKPLMSVFKAPLLPFELGGLKYLKDDEINYIELANANIINVRDLMMKGMIKCKGVQQRLVLPSQLLRRYAMENSERNDDKATL